MEFEKFNLIGHGHTESIRIFLNRIFQWETIITRNFIQIYFYGTQMIKFFNKYSFQILGSFNPNMGNSKYSKKTGTHTFLQIKIKKITHMGRRWDTPQHFFSAFIDELWKTQKIRILQKGKKIAGDIIILHMCTKNDNHMRYSSWDTVQEKNFFLSFWVIFDI